MKVLMVCLGNICRSPLAEGILKAKLKEKNVEWQVDSAGTSSWHINSLPDSRSIAIAHLHGIDITDQRARQFQASDLDNFDLILAMDADNYNAIIAQANKKQVSKVKMILNYTYPDENRRVPDPYYNDGFEMVYQLLDVACDQIIKFHT